LAKYIALPTSLPSGLGLNKAFIVADFVILDSRLENVISSTKPDVGLLKVSQRRHRRTELWPQVTCTKIAEGWPLCRPFRVMQAML